MQTGSMSIVHEDTDLLVINKPAGLLTHPKSPNDQSPSVAGWLREKYPSITKVGDDPVLRPGLVHRLDKETSGLMIIAKNQGAFSFLKNLFQKRLIKKTYLALVYGRLKDKSGIINLPLGKIGAKQTTKIHGKKELAQKTAVTEYAVINYFLFNASPFTLLSVSPLTGRTHQIRVHLQSIGHPVVCDRIYGGKRQACPSELGHLFLHAQKLEFTSPSGQALVLEADPPQELTDFLNSSTISP